MDIPRLGRTSSLCCRQVVWSHPIRLLGRMQLVVVFAHVWSASASTSVEAQLVLHVALLLSVSGHGCALRLHRVAEGPAGARGLGADDWFLCRSFGRSHERVPWFCPGLHGFGSEWRP